MVNLLTLVGDIGYCLVLVIGSVIVWGFAAFVIFWILAGIYVLAAEALRAIRNWLWSQLHPEIWIVTNGTDWSGVQLFETFWSETKARKYADDYRPTRTLHRAYLR